MINDLKSAGLKIYTGDNPPDIDGIYHINPLEISYNTMIDGTTNNNPVGKILSYSLKIQVLSKNKGQDFSLQSDLAYFNQSAKDYFIMGSGNDFTMVYTKYDPQAFNGANDAATFAYLISGTLENNGLKNVQVANIVIKENTSNAPNAKTMLGTLRIIKDKDGNSEKVASL